MQHRLRLIVLFTFLSSFVLAQNDSIWLQRPTLKISGFLDVFYVYDFNQPRGVKRQSFLFNHNRHNEFGVNLGFLKLGVEQTKYRANLALQTGTYPNDNYSSEPGVFQNIYEANVGLSLSKKNNLWLDAGVFSSHIGFEGAVSIDNWTLTRSLLAENSPYYFSGAKLTYTPASEWEIAGLILNGWQRIQRLQGNSLPSVGTQVKYVPSDKTLLNWSTYIGTDDPDTARRMRYFNNIYGQFQLAEGVGLIIGFDFGVQQRTKNNSTYDVWYSPVVVGQFKMNENWKATFRAEYYEDKTGVIIPTDTPHGFATTGLSLNFDYSPQESFICRIEGRWLNSRDRIFETKNTFKESNFIIATSIAIRFSDTIKGKSASHESSKSN